MTSSHGYVISVMTYSSEAVVGASPVTASSYGHSLEVHTVSLVRCARLFGLGLLSTSQCVTPTTTTTSNYQSIQYIVSQKLTGIISKGKQS